MKIRENDNIINDIYTDISKVIIKNKNKMTYQINNTLLKTYFNIGKIIVENEQNGNIRAEYGKDLLNKLSKKLTNKFGKGFSVANLYNMRLFYKRYKNFQPLAGNLSWSHYCYLIYIEDDKERSFYEQECINSKWSKRELKRQMNMYINYYDNEVKDDSDNKTVGIILCTGKKGITMEYALGGLSNNIFASTYTYYIPNKEELINEVEKILKETNSLYFN